MPQIANLTSKTTPISTDEIVIQETGGGTTKKVTLANVWGNQTNLNIADTNGVTITPGSDTDTTLFTLSGVTGTPTIIWDESADAFNFDHGINVSGDVNLTVDNTLDVVLDNSSVGSVSSPVRLYHTITTGTPVAGIGTGIQFITETVSGSSLGMSVYAVTTNVGSGTQDFDCVVNLMSGGSAAAEKLRVTAAGNVIIGAGSQEGTVTNALHIFNGTSPGGNVTDGVMLFAEDASASSELKVRDEAGNETTLSPHNFSLIPDGPSEDMAWAYYSEKNGKKINVDMLKLARKVEELTGEKLVYDG